MKFFASMNMRDQYREGDELSAEECPRRPSRSRFLGLSLLLYITPSHIGHAMPHHHHTPHLRNLAVTPRPCAWLMLMASTLLPLCSNAQTLKHDANDRLIEITLPDGRSQKFVYDAAGNLRQVTRSQTPRSASKLPHTGITESQCYRAGSNALVSCSSPEAIALSGDDKQDGMYTEVNPMSYSRVGSFGLDECVKDNVTGLMWEGKTASGTRAGTNLYTNWGDGRSGDASVYAVDVNTMRLCGYNDWRLPTVDEVETLVDAGKPSPGPTIQNEWFLNTAATLFWSSTLSAHNAQSALNVDFGQGHFNGDYRGYGAAARLVRGAQALPGVHAARHLGSELPGCPTWQTAERFEFLHDGAEVRDVHTGLVWARCSAGQTWSGSACTGGLTIFNHEAALAYANAKAGWRLPSRRELSSIADKGCSAPAIDQVAFPTTPSWLYWSTSPFVGNASFAWSVGFDYGYVSSYDRHYEFALRLVRVTQ